MQWSRYNVESESGGFRTNCYEDDALSVWAESLDTISRLIKEHEAEYHGKE